MNTSWKRIGGKAWRLALSILLAFVVGAIIIAVQGHNPLEAYGILIKGAFGSVNNIGEALVKAVPIAFCGLSVMFAFKCSVFNIGAQGQVVWGAIGAILVALNLKSLPAPIVWILAILVGALLGGIWGMIPGIFKAYRGVNEIITTILMNYIASGLLGALVTGPLKETAGRNPQTDMIEKTLRLPILIDGTRAHLGVILVIITAFLLWYYLRNTTKGYKLRAVGMNASAASCYGISVSRNIVKSMFIAGAIAGIAGCVEILGVQFRVINTFGLNNYGFDGIAMALLGQLSPFGILISSLGFGLLRTGAGTMQRLTNIQTSVVDLVEALIILFIVCDLTFNWLKKRKKPAKAQGVKADEKGGAEDA